MPKMLHMTRGGTSPQGKPRVYFACHEQDHQAYFQLLADEILKISDCAIFYYEPGEAAADEDHYLDLSQMQLVFMPVTSRLLCSENCAMDADFPYAVEHHIPVLPLMQEPGLEARYSEKFGDLQFLDKHNEDPTAIPYEQKLKNYLEMVLIGDELARKVRDAFDAYIFLSYRKKDRKYAQKLMTLLHQDPVCRDIAIWYDEFLTPGEDFNDAIRAALEKCHLFVMAVTPNLVNETNYIMTTEYPMAKDASKPILPAEMVPTDAAALRERYAGIPDSVDPENERVLTGAMMDALRAIALRANDRDPQHNFFIGLAYLSGIDVEVDHGRALMLITGAAEDGLPEAMEKLVFMYENGEGVKRDYSAAILWREKLTELARKRWEKQLGNEKAGQALIDRLWDLGDAWAKLREYKQAQAAYDEMRKTAAYLVDTYLDIEYEYQRYLGISYSKLAEVAYLRNLPADEKKWLQKCLEVRQLRTKMDAAGAKRDMATLYRKLGRSALGDDLEEAKDWFRKSLQITEQLARDDNMQSLRDLCLAYDKMGDAEIKEKNYPEAKQWYQKSLELTLRLEEMGEANAADDLLVSYRLLADTCEEEGNPAEALQWLRKRLDAALRLAESGTHDSIIDLASAYRDVGTALEKMGNKEEAGDWLIKAAEVFVKLFDIGAIGLLVSRPEIFYQAGDVCWERGDREGMEKWYFYLLRLFDHFDEEKMTYGYGNWAAIHWVMSETCKRIGDSPVTDKWNQMQEQIGKSLQEHAPPIDSLDDLFAWL